jgi:hypothetical protein
MTHLHYHLSDLRTGLMLRRIDSPLRIEAARKADRCAGTLAEARRMAAYGVSGTLLADLLARSVALLDELDEALLALDHARDEAVFVQLALMRRELTELRKRYDGSANRD